jgi:hypothetical protein
MAEGITVMEPKQETTLEAQQAKRLKKEAQAHWDAILAAGPLASSSSLRIGYHAYRLKSKNEFGVLGFESESQAREAANVGPSTWYQCLRLAEAFKDVPEKAFCAMRHANATALADMPESKRTDSVWLRMAETMSLKEFAAKVDEEMQGKARESGGKERSTTLKLVMPKSRETVIKEKVQEFATAHGVDAGDTGKVFELMAIETTGTQTLMGAITTAVQRLKRCKEIMASDLSADEALVQVQEELDSMTLEFAAALEQAAGKVQEAA